MKRSLALLFTIAVAAAAVAIAAPTGSTTTSPGYNFKIDVIITKGGQTVLSRSLAKRGWLAHFVIHNKDKRKHTFDVGGLKTKKPILPGKIGRVGAYLDTRGQYPYHVDGKLRGYFVVN